MDKIWFYASCKWKNILRSIVSFINNSFKLPYLCMCMHFLNLWYGKWTLQGFLLSASTRSTFDNKHHSSNHTHFHIGIVSIPKCHTQMDASGENQRLVSCHADMQTRKVTSSNWLLTYSSSWVSAAPICIMYIFLLYIHVSGWPLKWPKKKKKRITAEFTGVIYIILPVHLVLGTFT